MQLKLTHQREAGIRPLPNSQPKKIYRFVFYALLCGFCTISTGASAQEIDSLRLKTTPEMGDNKMELHGSLNVYVSDTTNIQNLRVRLGALDDAEVTFENSYPRSTMLVLKDENDAFFLQVNLGHLELMPPAIECILEMADGATAPPVVKHIIH